MPESAELEFGRVAVALGFLKSNQLAEALTVREKMRQAGKSISLQKILSQKGYLTEERIADIALELNTQKADTSSSEKAPSEEIATGSAEKTSTDSAERTSTDSAEKTSTDSAKKTHTISVGKKSTGPSEKTSKRPLKNLRPESLPVTKIMPVAKHIGDAETKKDHTKCQETSVQIPVENELPAGYCFGRYRILEVLGQGGMGRVYKAYDSNLDRHVALKMLLSSGQQTDVERFLREAKATAKMHHPYIVNVYDIGCHEGHNFFTMDLLEGVSLAQIIQEHKSTLKESLDIIKKVAEAVHYAHSQGIIHRDLKPANVMIDQNNEPKVMDFGLAKILGSQEQLSQSGVMIGTLLYMPPEQADGRIKDIDTRSDIYALGAILYELLTFTPPFTGDTFSQILVKLLHEDPIPPSELNKKVPKPLDNICLKALEKDKEKRYPDAAAFLHDIQIFEAGKSEYTSLYTFKRHVHQVWKRYKIAMSVVAVVVLAIMAGVWLGRPSVPKMDNVQITCLTESPYLVKKPFVIKVNGFFKGKVLPNAQFEMALVGNAKIREKEVGGLFEVIPHNAGKLKIVAQDKDTGIVGYFTADIAQDTTLVDTKPPVNVNPNIPENSKPPQTTKPAETNNLQTKTGTEKKNEANLESQSKEVYGKIIKEIPEENFLFRWKALKKFPENLISTATGKQVKSEIAEIEKTIQKNGEELLSLLDSIQKDSRLADVPSIKKHKLLMPENQEILKELASDNPSFKTQLESLQSLFGTLEREYEQNRRVKRAERKVQEKYAEFQKKLPELIASRDWDMAKEALKKMHDELPDASSIRSEIKILLMEIEEIVSLFGELKDAFSARKEKNETISISLTNGKFLRGKILKVDDSKLEIQDYKNKVHTIAYSQIKAAYLIKFLPECGTKKTLYLLGKLLWCEGQKEQAYVYLQKSSKQGFPPADLLLKQLEKEEREEKEREAKLSSKQQEGKDRAEEKGSKKRPSFQNLDRNHNGKIERNEWIGGIDEFLVMDKDKDGAITEKEFIENPEDIKFLASENKRYYNKEAHFSILFPDLWEKKENYQGTDVLAISPAEIGKDYKETVAISSERFRDRLSLDQYLEANRQALRNSLSDYTELQISDANIAKEKAKVILASYKVKLQKQELPIKALFYIFVKESRGYAVVCASSPDLFQKYRPKFEEIVGTFRFLGH